MIPAVMSKFFPLSPENASEQNHEIFGELPDNDASVTLLGVQYDSFELEEIKNDLQTRLWFTYRKNFANIGGNGPTSDQGWGCMLRAGQMMIAECMIRLRLGRPYQWKNSNEPPEEYFEIIEHFKDTHQSILSIQQIALTGASAERRKVGEWFGPNTMAQVLRRIAADGSLGLRVVVAMDSVVCRAEVINELTKGKSILLIIPLRLGLESVNDIYIEPLMNFLKDSRCVGIMGGKPNQAHYFVGCQHSETSGDWLLYLDPHTTQAASVATDLKEFDQSLHTSQMCWMKAKKLDPSCACGFLFESIEQFDDWCETISESSHVPFGIVEVAPSRDVNISSTIIAADSDDSASDYEVLDIQ